MQTRLVSRAVFALVLCDKLMQEWEGSGLLPPSILSRIIETNDASDAIEHLRQMAAVSGVDLEHLCCRETA